MGKAPIGLAKVSLASVVCVVHRRLNLVEPDPAPGDPTARVGR